MWVAHSPTSCCGRSTELTQTPVSSFVHCSSAVAFGTVGLLLKLCESHLQLESPVLNS